MDAFAGHENEVRLGRVVVRAIAGDGASSYRDATKAKLVIERAPIPFRLTQAQLVATGIAIFLAIAVLVLALATGSRPALGVVPIPPIALVVGLVIALLRTQRMSLIVANDHVSMTAPLRSAHAPIDRIDSIDVGNDAPYRTVWMRVQGVGRVLVLDGLDEREATLAAGRLREALELP
jgi:hypothetical protein